MEIVVSPDALNKIIGPVAHKYLHRAKVDKFGLYWNKKNSLIGNSMVGVEHNAIIINTDKYTGTHRLWRFITYNMLQRRSCILRMTWKII